MLDKVLEHTIMKQAEVVQHTTAIQNCYTQHLHSFATPAERPLRSWLCLWLCQLPTVWFLASIIYAAPVLQAGVHYTCQLTAEFSNDNLFEQYHSLRRLDLQQFVLQRCQQFSYAGSYQSLLGEFNLACGGELFAAWSQFWHLFGLLLAGLAVARLQRLLNARQLLVGSLLALSCCGLLSSNAPQFSWHCACQLLCGVCCGSLSRGARDIATVSNISSEQRRLVALLLCDIGCSLALLLLPGLAALAQSWRHIYLGISVLSLLLLPCLCWMPESTRWLLHAKAQPQAARAPNCSWLSLRLGQLLAAHLALAAYGIVHLGLLLQLRSLTPARLTIGLLTLSLAEICGYLLALYMCLQQRQRKWLLAGGLSILAGCLGCLCCWLHLLPTPAVYEFGLHLLLTALPKSAVACGQFMLLSCLTELLPAAQQATFACSMLTWAQLCLLAVPFLMPLQQWSMALSFSVYCVLTVLAGICSCCLTVAATAPQQQTQLTVI